MSTPAITFDLCLGFAQQAHHDDFVRALARHYQYPLQVADAKTRLMGPNPESAAAYVRRKILLELSGRATALLTGERVQAARAAAAAELAGQAPTLQG